MKKLFYKLSISNKLAVVFFALLFMMGVGGAVGLYNANQLAKVTERLYTNSFMRGETLSAVENEFLSARHEMFLHTIISDEASKSYLEGSIDEHKKKIRRLLNEYRAMGIAEGHEDLYNDFLKSLVTYWSIHSDVLRYSRRGMRDKALSIVRMEGNKSFTDSVNALRRLVKRERDTAYTTYRESNFFASVIFAVTIAFTALAIVTVGGLWLMLTRSMVRPILAIEDSARKIAHGDLEERVPVMTEDELGTLAVEFNKMAGSIEEYYGTLEKKVAERTEELNFTNIELSNSKQELELANIELHEANKMKSQFLANVSHELRTPLNSIIGFSELLQEKSFGELNERQHQYVEFVHSSGQHLLQLINNILDLSKIEAGRMEMTLEEFPVTEVLGEILGIIRPLAHKRKITIESKTVPASPKFVADRAKFKQIMMNLLSNAVKFNVEGGRVTVDWDIVEEPVGVKMERYLLFKVEDTGIGIRKEDSEKLFKEFEQLDSSITREYGGTGLGLVLTKRLVELHNGTIWFESEEGVGSVFHVKVPQGTDEIDMPVLTETVLEPHGSEDLPVVLIASESHDINHLLEIYLSGGAYDVITASDGFDLLRKAREQSPFAIVMGIAIPKKDGWEALKELKSNPVTADIPVIIISSTDIGELGYSLGAVECMGKPIKRQRLLNVLFRLRNPRRPDRARLKILLAEHDQDTLRGTGEYLESRGYSVSKTRAGAEAFEAIGDSVPDVVVASLRPNGGLDMELINGLNRLASTKKTRVFVLSSAEFSESEKGLLDSNVRMLFAGEVSCNETLLDEIRRMQTGQG